MSLYSKCKKLGTVHMQGDEPKFDAHVIGFVMRYGDIEKEHPDTEKGWKLIGLENTDGKIYRHITANGDDAFYDTMRALKTMGLTGYIIEHEDSVVRGGFSFDAIFHA